ncbi:hypothetical protein JOE63_003183 [Cellulosimicrobium cellulans]|uniref:hypothetical protein n=1 Tax=Cellulosimicrobium cellulans TaxID=1710 RepID=UPI0019582181|nr:hypothetical protein [Cellulosimicrobium cellulans]MBM7820706.1 hypothetical protein [Cellulosimicrobium cellulans]
MSVHDDASRPGRPALTSGTGPVGHGEPAGPGVVQEPGPEPETGPSDVAACERVFRRNGLPLLVEGHSVDRDVFGRSAPFLLVVLLAELTGALRSGWPAWANALALLGGAAIVAGAYAGLNVLRGRAWSTLPQSVGVPELAFFVLVPALLPLVFGGQWDEALLTVVGNLVLLGVLRVVVGYGVLSSLWWGLARVTDELGAALLRLVRLLPLLLVFSLVLFYNAEVWQVFDRTHGVADLVLGAFFALLVVLFVALRSPGEAREALAETAARLPGHERATRFSRGQTANLATMIASSQLLQVLVVSLGMGVFFMALGTLTVTPEVMALWDVDGGTWQQTLSLAGGGGVGGADLVVTQTLLRVSVAIATFTGLYYAISVQVDAVYREEFVDGIETQLADVVRTRTRYLALLDTREIEPPVVR